MEFLAGIIATLLVGYAVYKIREQRQKRKDRAVQATRRVGVGTGETQHPDIHRR